MQQDIGFVKTNDTRYATACGGTLSFWQIPPRFKKRAAGNKKRPLIDEFHNWLMISGGPNITLSELV